MRLERWLKARSRRIFVFFCRGLPRSRRIPRQILSSHDRPQPPNIPGNEVPPACRSRQRAAFDSFCRAASRAGTRAERPLPPPVCLRRFSEQGSLLCRASYHKFNTLLVFSRYYDLLLQNIIVYYKQNNYQKTEITVSFAELAEETCPRTGSLCAKAQKSAAGTENVDGGITACIVCFW